MSARPTRTPNPEDRKKLFRRMEWVFVYAPPLLILFLAGSAAALLAWLVPVAGLGFWAKWGIVVVLVIGVPLLGHLIRRWLSR